MTILETLEKSAETKRIELDMAIEQIANEKSYLNLNDLYLNIQSGKTKLNKSVYYKLYDYLFGFESRDSSMFTWWESEFRKLPDWLNV